MNTTPNIYIEILGWVAMAITMASFAFTDMRTLRGVNILGCLCWLVYGTLISSSPVIITNLAIGAIHVIWFIRNRRKS
jgi:hypothetical protein